MSMLKEFRAFAVRGNVIDLAVGVIIGAAFSKIVDSLVKDIIMPIVGTIFGGLDFSDYYIPLNGQGSTLPLEAARNAGAVFAYGNFITILLNFFILAFIIFQMVRLINKARALAIQEDKQQEQDKPVAPPPEDVLLLREIRDALRPGGSGKDTMAEFTPK